MKTKIDLGVLLLVCIMLISCSRKQPSEIEEPATWSEWQSPITNHLNCVFALSENNAWAVGDSGVIIKWNGNEWNFEPSPTSAGLNGVYFLDSNDGWVVGVDGLIFHWDGATWEYDSTPVAVSLNAVCFIGIDNGWAVGDSGIILHYDGNDWVEENSSITHKLRAVDFISSTDGWTAGNGYILHYDGNEWVVMVDASANFASIYFIGSADGWAVVDWTPALMPQIRHYDGDAWNLIETFNESQILKSIAFTESNYGWAVGTVFAKYDGTAWEIALEPAENFANSISLISTEHGWAVGRNGYIWRLSVQE